MPTIEDTLKRLATIFVVRDIMIPDSSLVCAENDVEARAVSAAHPDFNVIPIRREGKLASYFERDSRKTKEIAVHDLISDGTNLFDLVEFFAEREFAFVLSHRHIGGYVHFSDLNHDLVKLAVYVILEAVERQALVSLRPEKSCEEFLQEYLSAERFNQIKKRYKRDGDAARSLLNYLNISDALTLAVKQGSMRLDERTIRDVKRMRDGAAHVLENLVANYDDVRKLANVRRECQRILGA